MKSKTWFVDMILVFFLLTSAAVVRAAPGPPLDPELNRALLAAEASGDDLRVIVYLRETPPPTASVAALQAHATRTQAPIRAYLDAAQAAGQVTTYTPFWIFDGLAVRAAPETVRALAARPDVAAVRLDHYRRWVTTAAPVQTTDTAEWGITRIRADQVWASLHITGTGVVVAGMDTGVDWLHPALQTSYRGYDPRGLANHLFNWYDATSLGATYPLDGHGHGTHTLGTIVGSDGIGVAPGARWIGVRVLNSAGYGYDSWIHAGFQWLLAPGGDPAMAPDIVNCSWGNHDGDLTTFQPDLQALRAAGIFVVFAAGNDGPTASSINSPASLPEAFAVGAGDDEDEVANFSSRGPSPWGEIRPHVIAPGVDIRSALPGGVYGSWSGTSMAAPHVGGILALMRAVSPTLSVTRAAYILTSTAVPLGDPVPNNDSGWGRVDALAAVANLIHPGYITGTVMRADDGTPIAGATVQATRRDGPTSGHVATAADGHYLLILSPGEYDLTIAAFGYETATLRAVPVTTDTTTVRHIPLTPLPSGGLRVHIADGATGQPVTATVSVLDTPYQATSSAPAFALPTGEYRVRAFATGYRIITETVTIRTGGTTNLYLSLPPTTSILIVDSGAWYYGSYRDYLAQALEDLGYGYDIWEIKHLPADVPISSTLTPYDLVLWTAPRDSPGYVGAEEPLVDYLSQGGRLLLTGQDIGYWDGGGVLGYQRAYYNDYLKTYYVGDDAPTRVLDGADGTLFAGMTITITGGDGADNQGYPDEITPSDLDAAEPLLRYRDGQWGAVGAKTCLDYRTLYLSFGFEAIDNRADRREILARALDWLTAPAPVVGVELQSDYPLSIGLPGDTVTHTVRVRHMGQSGITDTFRLSLEGVDWEAHVLPAAVTLTPCGSTLVTVTVAIPPTATWDARDVITLVARSTVSPAVSDRLALTGKAPAPILLVDDERWYNHESDYRAALEADGLPYDYWRTGWQGRNPPWDSPPPDILARYPLLLWFTGYDWYRPITADESAALMDYLDAGGRLFLSSQDYLWYHHDDPLTQDYLGVLTYTESVTPTRAVGVTEDPIGDHLGSYALTYPFQNHSDGMTPAPTASVSLRDGNQNPIGLSRADKGYKTAFFSFPCEVLPSAGLELLLERAIGWLGWLGDSDWHLDPGLTVAPGETVTFTFRLHNDGPTTVTASFSNTIPAALTLVTGSIEGPAAYDPVARRLTWEGPLPSGASLTQTYRAVAPVGTALPDTVRNTAYIRLAEHAIGFRRTAVVRIAAADLSASALDCGPEGTRPGGEITCTLDLRNIGPGAALTVTATCPLPSGTAFITGDLGLVTTGTLRWDGPLPSGGHETAVYRVRVPTAPRTATHYWLCLITDGSETWERAAWTRTVPWRVYLPVVLRS